MLVKTLLIGGASVAITGCNSFSTQDEVAATSTSFWTTSRVLVSPTLPQTRAVCYALDYLVPMPIGC